MNEHESKKKTVVEQIDVAGSELVERVKSLLAESSTRRVIVRDVNDHELMSIPLTFGVVAGGLITLAVPLLAALGALAALVSHVKLEVIREVEGQKAPPERPSEASPPS